MTLKGALDWIEQCLTSPPKQYRLSGRQFYSPKDQTNSIKVLKEKCYKGCRLSILLGTSILYWRCELKISQSPRHLKLLFMFTSMLQCLVVEKVAEDF